MSDNYDWQTELSAMAHNAPVQDYVTEQQYWDEQAKQELAEQELAELVAEAEYCNECPFYQFERCAVYCEVDDV